MAGSIGRRLSILSAAVAATIAGGGMLLSQSASTGTKTGVVEIRRPSGPPRIGTSQVDALGREITVSCASCHANYESNPLVNSGEQLTQFHQGLHFQHGELTCGSCHHPDDYNSLRRADGRPLAFPDVMQLCAQCHGPQYRDYQHGAHGGMTGYWDLSRGGRQRKSCIDCHDPHAPAYPSMTPKFHPFDRFLATPPHDTHDD